jgi:hypothetical protein
MLGHAVKAGLPLIAIQSDDPLNIGAVLNEITGRSFNKLPHLPASRPAGGPTSSAVVLLSHQYYWCMADEFNGSFVDLYRKAAERDSIVVIVNPDSPHWTMFDAGTVSLPESMLTAFVSKYVDEANQFEVTAALRGLSYKAVTEVCKLAAAQYNALTGEAIIAVRRNRTPLASGLRLVDTQQTFYIPNEELLAWLDLDGFLFIHDVNPLLKPRGLIFTGPPGTGKTSGAKYVAHSLKLPLYYIDVGSLLGKWVGESERNLRTLLAQLEQLSPCVVLFDEVEKLFRGENDSGVVTRLLSMLLWWLQEHQTNVLTLMTTNDEVAIPKELYRPGRIDRELKFVELGETEARNFGLLLAKSLHSFHKLHEHEVVSMLDKIRSGPTVSQARITFEIYRLVKRYVVNELKE